MWWLVVTSSCSILLSGANANLSLSGGDRTHCFEREDDQQLGQRKTILLVKPFCSVVENCNAELELKAKVSSLGHK